MKYLHFSFTVDLIHIPLRKYFYFFVGQLQQFIPGTKQERLFRTYLNTGGQLFPLQTRETEGTFHYSRRERICILICRYLKRTRHHAVAATDALPSVVGDWTLRMFFECPDEASRNTCRVFAVHTLNLYVEGEPIDPFLLETVYNSVLRRCRSAELGEDRLIVETRNGLIRKSIDVVARPFALTAADTLR